MKARIIFTITIFFISIVNLYSQITSSVIVNTQSRNNFTELTGGFFSAILPSEKKIEGSVYLFPSFETVANLQNSYGKQYSINNFNIDLVRDAFVSKISKDSLFMYSNVIKAKINNALYVKITEKIYKVIYLGEKVKLYSHSAKIEKKEKIDRLTKQILTSRKWVVKQTFFYSKGGGNLVKIKLKKKDLIKLISSDYRKRVKNFAKKESLSFKKIKHIKKIFKYYDSL